jgi:alpha-1,6-mannosyltransferase
MRSRHGIALAVLTMAASTLVLGYHAGQRDFALILAAYSPFFLAYGYVVRHAKRVEGKALRRWLTLGALLRLALLFSMPALSDDVYRFVWDGRLLAQGYNPFAYTPSYLMESGSPPPGLDAALYERLNSPHYFTIYPPVAQGVFAFSAWLFPNSLPGSVLTMKAFLIGCELFILALSPRLLRAYGRAPGFALFYALNPLVIIEVSGNLHFEGAMASFLLLALWYLKKDRLLASAGAMALSIGAKLLPLMFLPFFIFRLGWRRSGLFFSALGLALIALFFPLASKFFANNFGQSLDLYFRKFEFNGGIYYLLRWIGYQKVGYNMIATIGPSLALITLLGIAAASLLDRERSKDSLPGRMFFAICLFLFLMPTVHPWYVILPVALCAFTGFRFPLWWSALITLTYVNYSYSPYWENLYVVALEYLIVAAILVFELYRHAKTREKTENAPASAST